MDEIIIFDTTLRDGEQSPGASLEAHEKLEIAKQLARLNVDIIEAGFPISSPGDFEAVKLIARRIKGPTICGLARCLKADIDAAKEAIRPAKRKRIHVFLATSKIHMRYKLKKAEDEIVRLAVEGVRYARRFTDDVEFSPEDASRSEKEFLYRVIEAVIDVGANTVNIPDTVGYAMPDEFGELIYDIRNNVPNIERAIISVHCHDDLGLAVSNSLAAVKNGARQVECTINGIGERAGNASMEEIVMAIMTRKDFFDLSTDIVTEEISKASRLVSRLTGLVVQPNKAIVGRNAFAHEAGIHQDGVLKRRTTYEIMRPEDVGLSSSSLVLGKHSGRHAFVDRMSKLGYSFNSASEVDKAFERFKELADKKKFIYDEDLETIMEEEFAKTPQTWRFVHIHTVSGTKEVPMATVTLSSRSRSFEMSASGDGPVDACYKAIDKITKVKGELMDYSIQSVTKGKDALGEVTVMVGSRGKVAIGKFASTDIIEASAKAYLNAINKLIHKGNKRLKIET